MFLRDHAVPPEWIARQRELAAKVQFVSFEGLPRYIAGADIAFSPTGAEAVAVAIVWDRQTQQIVEQRVSRRAVEYPYIPGFLSFREGPVLLDVIGKLQHPWEVICFDGQGIAHPRKCGLAAHMGVTLGRPSIGCGKSRLCGTYEEPADEQGSYSPLMNKGEQLGIVLRTRTRVKPLFISVGHQMDIDSARRIVMACVTRYRLPEPTRQADILTKKYRVL
jgi:deoxyribonuclease V